MPPVSTDNVFPPIQQIFGLSSTDGGPEHRASRLQHFNPSAWIKCRIKRPLSKRNVSSCLDETREFRIRNGIYIDGKCVDGDSMSWSLFRIMLVGAHLK